MASMRSRGFAEPNPGDSRLPGMDTISQPLESDWLRQAIRISFRGGESWRTSSVEEDPPLEHDPRFRKLIEGIHFSKRLLLTYHAVVIGFILLVSIRHWGAKLLRWQRSRRRRHGDHDARHCGFENADANDPEPASSSGSSTLEGTESPPRVIAKVHEGTALLKKYDILDSEPSRRSIWSYVRAVLIYQPPPHPGLFQTSGIFPSIGTCIVIAAFIGLNIFYSVYHIEFSALNLFILADRYAQLFVSNLPLLYICSSKTQPLKVLTGYSYESLNIFHRRLGDLMGYFAFLHVLGMLGVWYTLLKPVGFTFVRFMINKTMLNGTGAFISYTIITYTAKSFFRHLYYELFLGFHVILQVAALVLLFFHHSGSRIYVGIAFGIFLLDRIIYRLLLNPITAFATPEIMEDGETVLLTTTIDISKRVLDRFVRTPSSGWKAADHVFLTIPSLGRSHALQTHPFTIISPAPASNNDTATLSLLIRAQNGFSLDLLRAAETQRSLAVRIDGPYGSDHARSLLVDSNIAIIVAGGSGIAVAWPLINFLLDLSRSTDTRVATASELCRQRIILVWIVHQSTHISWIGKTALKEVENMGVDVILPPATEEVGRPDIGGLIRGIVRVRKSGGVGVVGSGPDGLGRTIRNTCAGLVRDGRNVNVTIEKFGW